MKCIAVKCQKLGIIDALHVTHYAMFMADCSNAFKKSVITTYHDSPIHK